MMMNGGEGEWMRLRFGGWFHFLSLFSDEFPNMMRCIENEETSKAKEKWKASVF